jgi:hypothetical protein
MVLQPFVGPLLLLQFPNRFYTVDRTSWTGDQLDAKPATYTQNNTESTHTDIHALRWIRTHNPSVRPSEDSSCLRPRSHRGRQYTDITAQSFHVYVFSASTKTRHSELHNDLE